MQPVELEEGPKEDGAALVADGFIPPEVDLIGGPVNGVQALLQAGLQSRKLSIPGGCCLVPSAQGLCLLMPPSKPAHGQSMSHAFIHSCMHAWPALKQVLQNTQQGSLHYAVHLGKLCRLCNALHCTIMKEQMKVRKRKLACCTFG